MSKFLWRIKTGFTKNAFLADKTVNADAIANTDDRIAREIENYQSDENQIDTFRKGYAANVLKLKKVLDTSSKEKILEIDDEIKKNTKQYENQLKKEIIDIEKVITLSQELVANEHLSVLYDIRRPMMLLEHYRLKLEESLKNVVISGKARDKIISLMGEINAEYDKMLIHTIEMSRQIQQMKVAPTNTSTDLVVAMEGRAKIKRQLNGRSLVLMNQIRYLEKYFEELKKKKILSDEEASIILNNIEKFKSQFSMLSTLAKTRTESSEAIIRETLLLQMSKMEELRALDEDIKKLIAIEDDAKRISPQIGNLSAGTIATCQYLLTETLSDDTKAMMNEKRIGTYVTKSLIDEESRLRSKKPIQIPITNKPTNTKNTTAPGIKVNSTPPPSAPDLSKKIVSDDSRIHSEGPSSAKPAKTGTALDWFRKKIFGYIMAGTMAFNMIGSTASAFNSTKLNAIPMVSQSTLDSKDGFNEKTTYHFSTHFDNKEGSVYSKDDVVSTVVKAVLDLTQKTRKDAQEKTHGQKANMQITIDGKNIQIIGGTDIAGDSTLNVNKLGIARAEVMKQRVIEALAIVHQKDSMITITNIDSMHLSSQINYDDDSVNVVCKNLNDYLASKFSGKYIPIDAEKIRNKNEKERMRFHSQILIYKENDKAGYEKNIIAPMAHLRTAHVIMTEDSKTVVLVPITTPPVIPPATADTPVREEIEPLQPITKEKRRKWFVPQDTTTNYKLQGYTRTNGNYTNTYGKGGNKYFKNNTKHK